MADSYIYTLPQAIDPALSDFSVVDTYVSTAGGYVTSKSTLLTLAQVTSSTIATALTSQQPIANWNTAFSGIVTLSGGWTAAQTVVSSSSADWTATYTVVQSSSANWDSTQTVVSSNSASWNNTLATVQSTSSTWGSGGNAFIVSTALQAASSNWQSTYELVSALSSTWSAGGSPIDFESLSTFETPLTATGEFITVTVGGQSRAIQLWKY